MSALHVTNGDSAAGTLRTFITDPVVVTCDVLHDGPAPRVDGDAWYDVRAAFLAETFDAVGDVRNGLVAVDRALTAPDYDEIVLWFEHDLYDQLLLIRTLDVIGGPERAVLQLDAPNTADAADVGRPFQGRLSAITISLICIGEFPGIDRFIGLGQLNAEQLASLYPQRRPVTDEHYAMARGAWRAFRADDPRELFQVMVRLEAEAARRKPGTTDDPMPFLADSIHRLFEEYPSTTNGLSRSANAVLRAVESGPMDALSLFHSTQQHEARPFMGDLGLFTIVRQLASRRPPLVTVAPGTDACDLRGQTVALTSTGRDVLGGQADAVALGGIDEWRGGVHLRGIDRSPWRWDPERKTLVS